MSGEDRSPEASEADRLEHLAIWGDLDAAAVARSERVASDPVRLSGERTRSIGTLSGRALLGLAGLWVFLLALAFMKEGARGLAPSLGTAIETVGNALGLGWLGALLVLSGSPVAASSLALFDGGSLSRDQSYSMVVGSRLGAAFVVLVIGAIYALRSTESSRRAPISIGVLALAMTAVVYIPGGVIGFVVLQSDVLSGITLAPPDFVIDATRAVTAPVVALVEGFISPSQASGAALLFALGVALLLASFRVVDVFLPSFSADRDDERARWYVGPWTMFGIGLAVALATLSVSVALSVLVPAVAKGYVRREQILPYIAGANITTLADTLLVAILLQNAVAPRIVLAVAIGVTVWTVLILLVAYQPLRHLVFDFQAAVLRTRLRLVGFIGVLFLCPVVLLLVR